MVGEEREALLAVTIPEERGSFRRFCEVVGGLPGGPRNVTEFNYRISDAAQAHVFVGITTNGKGESEKIAKNFGRHGFEALDLTHDELAKEHLRHLGYKLLDRADTLVNENVPVLDLHFYFAVRGAFYYRWRDHDPAHVAHVREVHAPRPRTH